MLIKMDQMFCETLNRRSRTSCHIDKLYIEKILDNNKKKNCCFEKSEISSSI